MESMTDGGKVTLATRVSMNPLFGKMDLGGGQRSMVEAQVIDEGSGIPTDARARVFDPFFTTKAAGVGTGLGLAVCKHLIATAGGSIDVGDNPGGKGAEFRLVIPNAS